MSRKHADNLALLYPENAAVQRLVRELVGSIAMNSLRNWKATSKGNS